MSTDFDSSQLNVGGISVASMAFRSVFVQFDLNGTDNYRFENMQSYKYFLVILLAMFGSCIKIPSVY